MKQVKIIFLAVMAVIATQVWAADNTQADKIRDRIKPVGTVCAGSACGGAATVGASARSGDTIYNKACIACHGSGLLNAPKKGDKAAWDARFAQGEETVLNHAIHGLNAMPPKGTCGDCSDDELLAAIKFMSGH